VLQQPTFRRGTRQLRPLQLGSPVAVVTVSLPHPTFQNDWGPLPSRIRPLELCTLRSILQIPVFVLLALQGVLRILNVSQEVAVTIKQEFACLLGQPLQLAITRWVGNPESTEIIEATWNDNSCVEGHEVLLTMPSRSQLYGSS